jgi:hypothetical protein
MVVVLWHVMAAEVCGNLGFLQTVYLVVQNAHDVHLCIVLKACNHLHKTHNQLTEKRTISELETKLKTGEAAILQDIPTSASHICHMANSRACSLMLPSMFITPLLNCKLKFLEMMITGQLIHMLIICRQKRVAVKKVGRSKAAKT